MLNSKFVATFAGYMENKKSETIFDRNVIEFVTVAVEYCKFLEQTEGATRKDFVSTIIKIIPLLYVKALLLPDCKMIGDEEPASFVTEDDYEVIRMNLQGIMGNRDDFLDVFVSDMKYSDQPITCYISELLTDIYQDLRNFISNFQLGINETMNDALALCEENFKLYWGQKTVNVMRALHEVYFDSEDDDELDDEEDGDSLRMDY